MLMARGKQIMYYLGCRLPIITAAAAVVAYAVLRVWFFLMEGWILKPI
jgi:hypothetical protein